jgi:phage major head subunit gpT-like protein
MSAYNITEEGVIGKIFHALSIISVPSWVDATSMLIPSTQETETYAALGQVPMMREWEGGRLAKVLRESDYTIRNKTYEATLEVLVDDLRRDKTGQLDVRINELARRAQAHWAKLLSDALSDGGSTLCWDGQYFFDSDHLEGDSGSQYNLLTNSQVSALDVTTTTAPTVSEMISAILGVIGYMLGYDDDQGEPMNEDAREFLVMVGTAPLWGALMGALGQTNIASGETNVLATLDGFKVRGAYNPRLSALTTNMIVFRTDADVKPLIRQEEVPIQVSAIAEGSELEFEENVHHYGIKAVRNVGYGFWQMASYSTFS